MLLCKHLWAIGAVAALLICQAPPAQAGQSEETVHLNGIDLRYRDVGTGEVLLLLHSFGSCASQWKLVEKELSAHYRLIIPDLREHGRSTDPENLFSMLQSAEDIAALLDHLQLRQIRAMGISAGGMTLLHLASRQPERVTAMVLIGVAPRFPEETRAIMRASIWDQLPQSTRDAYRPCAVRGEKQMKQLISKFHSFKDSYEDLSFTADSLALVRARTMIVNGDRDPYFPVELPVEIYRGISRSRLWIVPGGGHVPVFGRQLPEFLRVAQSFLSEVEKDNGP